MKQTQINGSTYVKCDDVADWILGFANEAREHDLTSDIGLVAEELSKALRQWGSDPERKVGVPNTRMAIR